MLGALEAVFNRVDDILDTQGRVKAVTDPQVQGLPYQQGGILGQVQKDRQSWKTVQEAGGDPQSIDAVEILADDDHGRRGFLQGFVELSAVMGDLTLVPGRRQGPVE